MIDIQIMERGTGKSTECYEFIKNNKNALILHPARGRFYNVLSDLKDKHITHVRGTLRPATIVLDELDMYSIEQLNEVGMFADQYDFFIRTGPLTRYQLAASLFVKALEEYAPEVLV